MQVEEYELRTDDRVIKKVPELRSAVQMRLGATYQTVTSALRSEVMAAAEYDCERKAGGGPVVMDTGEVTW